MKGARRETSSLRTCSAGQSHAEKTLLFVSEGQDWIDAAGAMRGDQAGLRAIGFIRTAPSDLRAQLSAVAAAFAPNHYTSNGSG